MSFERAAGRQARFEAIGRDGRAAVILAIIAAANRIGQDPQALALGAALMTAASTPGVHTPLS